MRNYLLILAGVMIAMLSVIGIMVSQVNALTIVDPWNKNAATFNPKGVKYGGGVTTGNELVSKADRPWAQAAKINLMEELNRKGE